MYHLRDISSVHISRVHFFSTFYSLSDGTADHVSVVFLRLQIVFRFFASYICRIDGALSHN